MRILLVHNYYRSAGGEDIVVQVEKSMLEDHGHEVALLEADNAEISGALNRISTGFNAVHSRAGKKRVAAELARFRPASCTCTTFFLYFRPPSIMLRASGRGRGADSS